MPGIGVMPSCGAVAGKQVSLVGANIPPPCDGVASLESRYSSAAGMGVGHYGPVAAARAQSVGFGASRPPCGLRPTRGSAATDQWPRLTAHGLWLTVYGFFALYQFTMKSAIWYRIRPIRARTAAYERAVVVGCGSGGRGRWGS